MFLRQGFIHKRLSEGTDAPAGAEYSEGDFTPELTFDTPGDFSVDYIVQSGHYTKIGNVVILYITIVTSIFTWTTASGVLQVTGAPFPCSSTVFNRGNLSWQGITKAGYTQINPRMALGSDIIDFLACGSGQGLDLVQIADTPVNGDIVLAIVHVYVVDP